MSAVLKNAGIADGVTNSDRYLAIKLSKEFEGAINLLELEEDV